MATTKPVDIELYEDIKYLALIQHGVPKDKAREMITTRFPMALDEGIAELAERGHENAMTVGREYFSLLDEAGIANWHWSRDAIEQFAAFLVAHEKG